MRFGFTVVIAATAALIQGTVARPAQTQDASLKCEVPYLRKNLDVCVGQIKDMAKEAKIMAEEIKCEGLKGFRFMNLPMGCFDVLTQIDLKCQEDGPRAVPCGEGCLEWPDMTPEEIARIEEVLV